MTTILSFAFVLGVLVFVHELGHFLMARWHGVRVLTFSLGFGPKIFTVRRGDTEYCISAFPLGGYVKMAGENPDDPQTGADDEFLAKTKWQRFQILIAGPVMNIVLAIVLLAAVLMRGADVLAYLDQPAVVGAVQEGSPAERAGIQPGDQIVKFGTADVRTWEHLDMAVAARPEREVDVTVRRNGREEALKVRPDLTELRTRGDVDTSAAVGPDIDEMRQIMLGCSLRGRKRDAGRIGALHRDDAGFRQPVDFRRPDFGLGLGVGEDGVDLGAAHRLDAAGRVDFLDREQRAAAALLAFIGQRSGDRVQDADLDRRALRAKHGRRHAPASRPDGDQTGARPSLIV